MRYSLPLNEQRWPQRKQRMSTLILHSGTNGFRYQMCVRLPNADPLAMAGGVPASPNERCVSRSSSEPVRFPFVQ